MLLKMQSLTMGSNSFRGPAPLYHTLLAGDTRTGITLQTLHAEKFDHGVLLDQTPYPGIEIPEAESCTEPQLVDFVGPLGAEMLVSGIRNRVFVQPVREVGWYKRGVEGDQSARLGDLSGEGGSSPTLRHAPKITTEDRHIKWGSWTAEDIMRRYRVLGPLWNTMPMEHNGILMEKRVIFSSLVVLAAEPDQGSVDQPGLPYAERDISKSAPENPYFFGGLKVKASDGSLIGIGELKIEGSTTKDGIVAAVQAGLFSSVPVYVAEDGENREFRQFKEALR
jgi:methionyl-tRNA formyltransferase